MSRAAALAPNRQLREVYAARDGPPLTKTHFRMAEARERVRGGGSFHRDNERGTRGPPRRPGAANARVPKPEKCDSKISRFTNESPPVAVSLALTSLLGSFFASQLPNGARLLVDAAAAMFDLQ